MRSLLSPIKEMPCRNSLLPLLALTATTCLEACSHPAPLKDSHLARIDIKNQSLIQSSPDHQTRFTDIRELHAGFNKWCWIDTPNSRRGLDDGYAVTWRPCKVSTYKSDSGKPMSTMSGGGVSWAFWEGTLGDEELKNVRIAEYRDDEKYANYGSGALSGVFKHLHRENLFCYDLNAGRICVADFE